MTAHPYRRALAAVAVLALVAGTVGGCWRADDPAARPAVGMPPAASGPEPGGRHVYGLESDPNGLDPTRNAWDSSGFQLANALYDPMVAFAADGSTHPYLVRSYEPDATFTAWTVRLRPGVVFSDGDPLDAAALAAFIEALRSSPISGPVARFVTGTRVVDPLTVVVTTSRPWATLPAVMAGQGGYVVSPKQLADPEGHSRPIGTGPFLLASWEVNERFELVRNPRYWRQGLPYLDAVDFVVDEPGQHRIDRIQRGDLDVTALGNSWDRAALDGALAAQDAAAPRLAVDRDPGDAEKSAIVFNTAQAPLDDVRVRRALAHATDVRAIATVKRWPLDRLARGPLDPGSPYFSPAAYPGPDRARARALLDEYLADPRVPNRPVEVAFTVTAPTSIIDFVPDLVAQWAEVGIRATIHYVDVKQVVRLVVTGNYGAAAFRSFSAVDPDTLWHLLVADTVVPGGISLNFARFRNRAVTDGMNEGRASTDRAERQRAYAKVQATLAAEVPYLWLERSEWRIARRPAVRDARNVTLPGGGAALPYAAGTFRLTETWLDR